MMDRAQSLVRWFFFLYIFSSPFYGVSLFNIGSRGLARIDWLAAGALIVIFSIYFIANRYPLRSSPTNQYVLLFLVAGLLTITNLFNASNSQFIDFGTKAAQLLLAITFFLVISSCPFTESEIKTGLRLWILAALIASLYAIYQVFALTYRLPFSTFPLTNPSVTYQSGEDRIIFGYSQVSSFFSEPSYLGAFLLGPMIVVIVFLLTGNGQTLLSKSQLFNWMILLVLASAFMLTGSQAAYISLLAVILLMIFSGRIARTKIVKLVTVLLFFLILGGIFLSLYGMDFFGALILRFKYLFVNIINPLETAEISSFRVRSECMLAAMNVWLSHPILGVGLNNLSYHTNVCEFTLGWSQLIVDQGILGTILLILVFWSSLKGLNRLSKEPGLSQFWSILSLSLIFVLLCDIVNGIFTYNWIDLQRWFTLGLANFVIIQANSNLDREVSISYARDRVTSSNQTGVRLV